jgi:glycosidase
MMTALRWRAAATARALVTAAALGSALYSIPAAAQRAAQRDVRDQVFYQIFVRSFRDSNGDQQGDLKGIQQQLRYLQQLGVTTLLLTPIGASPFYHNYFLDDFTAVDPEFGTERDLRNLTRALHQRGMQLYLDMELQYVSGNHLWLTDSFRKPGSRYTPYLLYQDSANTRYQTGFWEVPEVPLYDGQRVRIATVNLLNADVQRVQAQTFTHFLRPSAPGRNDGVDGFRIDHMQDTLDNKPALPDLFPRFWTPLFQQLRQVAPRVRILAEQADWGYGAAWLTRGNADMVFAFPLRGAILSFDKAQLTKVVAETERRTPAGKQQVLFIENHDVERFASAVKGDRRKAKVGAALNLLLKGIPLLYYGQELGMTGQHINDQSSDGGDIPLREAFPWTTRVSDGMAVWYRNSGLWWDQSPLARGGGVSLESQRGQPDSLLETYQSLLALRRAHAALRQGDQQLLDTEHPTVFAFQRSAGADRVLVVINLADASATTTVRPLVSGPAPARLRSLLSGDSVALDASGRATIMLPPYAVRVYGLR